MRVALLVLLSGCDVIFTLDQAGSDAPVPIGCMPGVNSEDFDNNENVCGAGASAGQGFVERANGSLVLEPDEATELIVTDVSCTWNAIDPISGAFVELEQPLDGNSTYTLIQFYDQNLAFLMSVLQADGTGPVLQFVRRDKDGLEVLATQTYDPLAMRWLRLRVEGGNVFAEYSETSASWTELDRIESPFAPGPLDASVNAGQFEPRGIPGTAILDNFNRCP